ncbi:MAG: type 4a pilus biogenesis protein PilO [Planctomycetaceae bacterium]|nr:type 4a pilus biogenesis protein PilO [Planctomycetaceae bacterium]
MIILAGIVLVCIVVPFCYSYFGKSLSNLKAQNTKLVESINKLEAEVKDEKQVHERLAELGRQSLPPGEQVKSQYQNWLSDTAAAAGLRERKVDRGTEATFKNFYKKYTFKLTCKGNFEQIVEFLRRFNKADYLHLVRKISPAPIRNSTLMDVTITVEALSVTNAKTSRTLRTLSKESLKITPDEQSVLDEIKARKLFTAYTPPTPPSTERTPSPREPPFYQAPYCYVIAIVESDGRTQVWIDHRAVGRQYKLYEGDSFRLEGVDCVIKKIEFDRIHVDANGQLFVIRQGKSFAEYD